LNERCAQAGEPLALLMRGVNLYTGGHYDEYDATFFDYKARPDCFGVRERCLQLPGMSAGVFGLELRLAWRTERVHALFHAWRPVEPRLIIR